ncbi:MAG TPA: hypothetical protein VK689_17040 [Armatimonadota bacterium]|nr:hypothetical protein [Armatimonadota bacterium]
MSRKNSFPREPAKGELKPWLKEQWCIPPKAIDEYVAGIKEVLSVYHHS